MWLAGGALDAAWLAHEPSLDAGSWDKKRTMSGSAIYIAGAVWENC